MTVWADGEQSRSVSSWCSQLLAATAMVKCDLTHAPSQLPARTSELEHHSPHTCVNSRLLTCTGAAGTGRCSSSSNVQRLTTPQHLPVCYIPHIRTRLYSMTAASRLTFMIRPSLCLDVSTGPMHFQLTCPSPLLPPIPPHLCTRILPYAAPPLKLLSDLQTGAWKTTP